MKDKLQIKIEVAVITFILCTTAVSIIHRNTPNVAAYEIEGEGCYILSTDMIHRVTENLSNVIYTAYDEGELRKGRAFGSKGEHYAADYLYDVVHFLFLIWTRIFIVDY